MKRKARMIKESNNKSKSKVERILKISHQNSQSPRVTYPIHEIKSSTNSIRVKILKEIK